MRRLLIAAGFALATALPASAMEGGAALAIPDLAYRERVLANGLQLLSIENHDSPTVSVQVWYRVGSKNDPEGRSGFAHLFEHLMFKGTKHLAAEQFDRLTEDVGGANNATTSDDTTRYYETVPSNHLERLLWAEAERLANLRVDETNFKSERAVVEEEYRQSVLARPYGRFELALQAASYRRHPYHRPTIGSIDDLEAASLADVVAFHQQWYRADDATLIVVGDFDPQQLDAWVDRYFGVIARPADPIPRSSVTEPPRSADRRLTERAPNVPLPALGITWLAPPAKSSDAPALTVAAALLGGGESSRLHQSLVYRSRIAQDAGFDFEDLSDGGTLVATAVLANGRKPAEAEKALLAEIERLRTRPIADAELEKAKNQLLTAELLARETNQGKGFALGHALIATGDAAQANRALKDLQTVSAADVQRVLKTYVSGQHKVVLEYLTAPAAARTAGAAK